MIDCKSNQARSLIMEGSNIKFKDHSVPSLTSSKIDVHLILFSDLLLICKKVSSSHTTKKSSSKDATNQDRVKVIRPPYLIDRLIPVTSSGAQADALMIGSASTSMSASQQSHHHPLSHGGHSFSGHHSSKDKDVSSFSLIYLNEFKVASALLSFSSLDAKTWLDQIRRAQINYVEAKKRAYLSISSPMYKSINVSTTDYAPEISSLYRGGSLYKESSLLHRDVSLYKDEDQDINNIYGSDLYEDLHSTKMIPDQGSSINNSNNQQRIYSNLKSSPSCTSLAEARMTIAQLQQQNQLLLQSHRSSRSSLFLSHSHSGSIELSEFLLPPRSQASSSGNTTAHALGSAGGAVLTGQLSSDQLSSGGQLYGSTLSVNPPTNAPSSTPNPWLLSADPSAIAQMGASTADLSTLQAVQDGAFGLQPSRARSFELGDLRNPSLTVDANEEAFCRSHSMETRGSPVHVVVTSARPERRAFLLKGSGSPSSSYEKYESSNSLNVPGTSGHSTRHSSIASGASGGRVTVLGTAPEYVTVHAQTSTSRGESNVVVVQTQPKPIMRSVQTQTMPPRNVTVISKAAATNTVTIGSHFKPPPPPMSSHPPSVHQPLSQTVSLGQIPPSKVLPPRASNTVGTGSGTQGAGGVLTRKATPPKVPPRKGTVPTAVPPPRPISSPAVSRSPVQRAISPINKPPLLKTKNVPPPPLPRNESTCNQGNHPASQESGHQESSPPASQTESVRCQTLDHGSRQQQRPLSDPGHSCGRGTCPSDQGFSNVSRNIFYSYCCMN